MSAFTILPKSGYKRVPWKNGRGETLEIYIQPRHDHLAAVSSNGEFDFRISSAFVDRPSEFSSFPDHNRILLITQGAGLRLFRKEQSASLQAHQQIDLLPNTVFSFSGADNVRADLLEGPVVDLNVFTRVGAARGRAEVRVLHDPTASKWQPKTPWNFAYAISGGFEFVSGLERSEINEGDTLLAGADVVGSEISLSISRRHRENNAASGIIVLIEIEPLT